MAGQPSGLEGQIGGDRGSPMTSGAVEAYISGSDGAATLLPLGNGHWAGSWQPRNFNGGAASVGISASGAGMYNDVVPFDIPVNTRQQLIIQRKASNRCRSRWPL